MKIKEHLENLPEPWASQAIENTRKLNPGYLEVYENGVNHIAAVYWAFDWEESNEGADYWADFTNDFTYGKLEYKTDKLFVQYIKERIDKLTDAQRKQLFDSYCIFCGSKTLPCHCNKN